MTIFALAERLPTSATLLSNHLMLLFFLVYPNRSLLSNLSKLNPDPIVNGTESPANSTSDLDVDEDGKIMGLEGIFYMLTNFF